MKKNIPPQEGQNFFFGAFVATPFPQTLKLEKEGFENFGGVWRGGRGVWNSNRPPPLDESQTVMATVCSPELHQTNTWLCSTRMPSPKPCFSTFIMPRCVPPLQFLGEAVPAQCEHLNNSGAQHSSMAPNPGKSNAKPSRVVPSVVLGPSPLVHPWERVHGCVQRPVPVIVLHVAFPQCGRGFVAIRYLFYSTCSCDCGGTGRPSMEAVCQLQSMWPLQMVFLTMNSIPSPPRGGGGNYNSS